MRTDQDVNDINLAKSGKVMIYYFAFPHYRAEVLRELRNRLGDRIEFCSGTSNRGGLKVLTGLDFQELQIFPTKRFGPFSWEKGIIRRAIFGDYSTVILAPSTTSISTWLILIFRWFSKKETFLWGQCGKPGDRSFKRLLQEVMNRVSSGLLVYGSFEVDGATEFGTPISKVEKVLNAVPLNPIPYTSNQLAERTARFTNDALERGILRLVFIGRINLDKNVEVLLEAGRLLKSKFSKISICLIGEGNDKERLQNLYSDPIFEFRGAIYDKFLLQKEIDSATFIVSPSLMGLLALDGLSSGIPVLIPDNDRNGSEVESLTPGLNGFYFAHDDPESLARQVMLSLQTMKEMDADQYYVARERALQAWSPAGVAQNICTAIGVG